MTNKQSQVYNCQHCDTQYPKWQGRCTECGKWGTIQEARQSPLVSQKEMEKNTLAPDKLIDLGSFEAEAKETKRTKTGLSEVDRVLGGGLIRGSLVLLGGDPGIGKSTLVLQLARHIGSAGASVFYISGEESASQIKSRCERLGIDVSGITFAASTDCDAIVSTLAKYRPQCAIVDSIQTLATADAEGVAGGIAQVRACTAKLIEVAKQHDVTVILVGHVTKEGAVAGPKTLEHLVDVVLYLEGEKLMGTRILRSAKNRFGSTSEIGVLTMTAKGLQDVSDTSRLFFSTPRSGVSGSAVGAVVEGSRVFFTDIEALVEKTSFGYPKRTVTGYDLNRLQMLLAVLHTHAGINFSSDDVYVQLPGGFKSRDPALDLAVCVALASAKKKIPVRKGLVMIGEVGLNGFLRTVPHQDKIIKQATSLGFARLLLPTMEKKLISNKIRLVQEETLKKALSQIFVL